MNENIIQDSKLQIGVTNVELYVKSSSSLRRTLSLCGYNVPNGLYEREATTDLKTQRRMSRADSSFIERIVSA